MKPFPHKDIRSFADHYGHFITNSSISVGSCLYAAQQPWISNKDNRDIYDIILSIASLKYRVLRSQILLLTKSPIYIDNYNNKKSPISIGLPKTKVHVAGIIIHSNPINIGTKKNSHLQKGRPNPNILNQSFAFSWA